MAESADSTPSRLKLLAMDGEDLAVVSAHLQDAALRVGDIRYSAADKRLIVELNRFVWESAERGRSSRTYERRRSVLHFNRVDAVRALGVDQRKKDGVLNLLAIRFLPFEEQGEDPSGEVELVFSGDAALRLLVECVESQITDLDASWETRGLPRHDSENSNWL